VHSNSASKAARLRNGTYLAAARNFEVYTPPVAFIGRS